ncbi:MAG: HAD-IA family hydrolase [Polyangiales bacterium]
MIFDLDGTLLDTLDDIRRALNRALTAHRRPTLERADVLAAMGDGARMLVARALRVEPHAPEVDDVARSYAEAYQRDPTAGTRTMPGVDALLDALDSAGIPMAVCTNKPRAVADAVLSHVLPGRFRAIVGGGDTPQLKPHRAPIDAVIAAAGATQEGAIMIGDAPQDVLAARAAGIASVAFLGGYGARAALLSTKADLEVERMDALVGLFAPL